MGRRRRHRIGKEPWDSCCGDECQAAAQRGLCIPRACAHHSQIQPTEHDLNTKAKAKVQVHFALKPPPPPTPILTHTLICFSSPPLLLPLSFCYPFSPLVAVVSFLLARLLVCLSVLHLHHICLVLLLLCLVFLLCSLWVSLVCSFFFFLFFFFFFLFFFFLMMLLACLLSRWLASIFFFLSSLPFCLSM